MSAEPQDDQDFTPPRWMVALVVGIGGVLVLVSALAWFAGGDGILARIGDILCL